jgi:DNA-binding transcriptional ArsR family regulator
LGNGAACGHNERVPRLYKPNDPDRDDEVEAAVQLAGSRPRHEIVRFLSEHGPSFRSDIADSTGIAGGALGTHLERLMEIGVISADIPEGKRTGRAVRYTLHPGRVNDLLDAWFRYAGLPRE